MAGTVQNSTSSDEREYQAFRFALDLTSEQLALFHRNCGARRVAFNWAVGQLKANVQGDSSRKLPTVTELITHWRDARQQVCANSDTGVAWWPDVSQSSFIDGIRSAHDGAVRWQRSQTSGYRGQSQSFPKLKGRRRGSDRVSMPAYDVRLASDRRTLHLPILGQCHSLQNTRKMLRLHRSRRLSIFGLTLRAQGGRVHVVFRVRTVRPQRPKVHGQPTVVGVDLGVRLLATVASADGSVLEKFENPRPLEKTLKQIRLLHRMLSRRTPNSREYRVAQLKLAACYQKAAAVRDDAIHNLTTSLAKRFAVVVIEALHVAEMLDPARSDSSRKLRRSLSDSALGLVGRHLHYKCRWYGSQLIVANRHFPSSRLCFECGVANDIGLQSEWTCAVCTSRHDRDENAARNLARYGEQHIGRAGPSPPG